MIIIASKESLDYFCLGNQVHQRLTWSIMHRIWYECVCENLESNFYRMTSNLICGSLTHSALESAMILVLYFHILQGYGPKASDSKLSTIRWWYQKIVKNFIFCRRRKLEV